MTAAIITVMMISLFSASALTTIEPNRISVTDTWQAELGNRTYESGIYDCTQFSNDFYDILKDDFNVSLMYGTLSNGGIHCWLEIGGKPFEATGGYWIKEPYKPQAGKVFKKVRRCW